MDATYEPSEIEMQEEDDELQPAALAAVAIITNGPIRSARDEVMHTVVWCGLPTTVVSLVSVKA